MTVDKAALRDLSDTLNGILLPEGYNRQALKDAAVALPALLAENEALRAELQARQWMPIESCPRGQLALFYDANATEVRNCMFVDWMVDGEFCGNRHHEASHWMPLPPAPPQGETAC